MSTDRCKVIGAGLAVALVLFGQRSHAESKMPPATPQASTAPAIGSVPLPSWWSEVGTALQRRDYATALRLLQPHAEAGDPAAQGDLGLLHFGGLGTPRNFSAAARWLQPAAQQGNAEAQNRLARMYRQGLGVPPDPARALQLYRQAVASGSPQHMFDLAEMLDVGTKLGGHPDAARHRAEAVQWYERAAANGFAEARANLGVLLLTGDGVAKDTVRARRLLEQAAADKHARAMNNLGVMYARGVDVAKDHATAAEWFGQAAEAGSKEAATNLGVMYENGFGVPRDEARARAYYRRGGQGGAAATAIDRAALLLPQASLSAVPVVSEELRPLQARAEAGELAAMLELADKLVGGAHWPGAPRQAANWYLAAAQRGEPRARHNIGVLYVLGIGVPEDLVSGYHWLNAAAASGSSHSASTRDAVLHRMTPSQIAEAERMLERH